MRSQVERPSEFGQKPQRAQIDLTCAASLRIAKGMLTTQNGGYRADGH
jgi:hypothetical protein